MKKLFSILALLGGACVTALAFIGGGGGNSLSSYAVNSGHTDNVDNAIGTNVIINGFQIVPQYMVTNSDLAGVGIGNGVFRNFIELTNNFGSLILDKSGNVDITGHVTFDVNGTGSVSSDGNGNLSAVSFTGDGSHLTGITGVSPTRNGGTLTNLLQDSLEAVGVGGNNPHGSGGAGLIIGRGDGFPDWRGEMLTNEEVTIGNGYVVYGGACFFGDMSGSSNFVASAIDGGIVAGDFSLSTNCTVISNAGSFAGMEIQHATNSAVNLVGSIFEGAMAGSKNVNVSLNRSILIGTPTNGANYNLKDTVAVVSSKGLTGFDTNGFFGDTATVTTVYATNVIANLFVGKGTGITNLPAQGLVPDSNINFVFSGAGNASMSGQNNIVLGEASANSLTTGDRNTIIGSQTAQGITTGRGNIVLGVQSMGGANDVVSIAIGNSALANLGTGGTNNIAIGHNAGTALLSNESSNILVGNVGVTGDSKKIRIGTIGIHTDIHFAGVMHGDGSALTNLPGGGGGNVYSNSGAVFFPIIAVTNQVNTNTIFITPLNSSSSGLAIYPASTNGTATAVDIESSTNAIDSGPGYAHIDIGHADWHNYSNLGGRLSEWTTLAFGAQGGFVGAAAIGGYGLTAPFTVQASNIMFGASHGLNLYEGRVAGGEAPNGYFLTASQTNLIFAAGSSVNGEIAFRYTDSSGSRTSLEVTNNPSGTYTTMKLIKSGGVLLLGGDTMVNSNLTVKGSLKLPGVSAPTSVTVGTTAPDFWVAVTNSANGHVGFFPCWENH